MARYLSGKTLRGLLSLLSLWLVDQDVVAIDGDPMVAWSVSIAAAVRNRFSGCTHGGAGGMQLSR